MSFDDKLQNPEPDSALRHALDQWPEPQMRTEFRERMREKFLAAPFEELAASELEQPDLEPAPIVASGWGEHSETTGRPEGYGTAPRKPWFTLATIAAIAAAMLFLFRWPRETGWRVADSSGFVLARVDGREFSPQDRERLAAALEPGSLVEVEGGALDLVLDTRVALSLASGCALKLVAVPGPNVLDALWLDQQRGSLAIVTGPDFVEAGLRIQTPDTEVRVVGTQFAVDVFAGSGTCVCCGQGSVSVFDVPLPDGPPPEGAAVHQISAGAMSFVFRDGRPMEIGASIGEHIAPLASLRQVWPVQR